MKRTILRSLALAFVTGALLLPSPDASAQDIDIIATVEGAGNCSTFIRFVTDAGLIETLKGPGPFTVFVPSDEAFGKVPAERLASLTKDRSAVRQLMLYHIIAGKLTSQDIARLNGRGTRTMQLTEARVTVDSGAVLINNARITKTDIIARNGVIHIIDAVIIPPGGGR